MSDETSLILAGIGLSFVLYVPCLWIAMKITRVGGNWLGVLVASVSSFIAAAVGGFFLGPIVGMIAGTIALYIAICKTMDASVFPDAFLMVVVTNVLYVFVWFQVIATFMRRATGA